jgi:uncharacterized surface anchored protein
VLFEKIPCGTFYLREISAPSGYQADETVYPVTVDETGAASCKKLAEASPANTIADEALRGSFTMVKVDETNPAVKISGTTYTLYRESAGEYVRLEDGVTGRDGTVTFGNLLAGTDYLLCESKASPGYQLSEKSAVILFSISDGLIPLARLADSGNGTVRQNPNGTFTWEEPPTRVAIRKQGPDGSLLSGAKLQIRDSSGRVVESWTSGGSEHLISGVLAAGETYTLQETEAPAGCSIAAPVSFTVEAKAETPNELFLQTVTMTDAEAPVPAASPRTGSGSPVPLLLLTLASGTGVLLLSGKKKRRRAVQRFRS